MRLNGSQVGEVNHLLPVSNGLLTPQHVKAIGPSLFLFLYYIDGITTEQDGFGLVHGGKPLPDEKASGALGVGRATVARGRERLVKKEYVRATRTGSGYIIRVAKSKKFLWRHNGDAGEVLNSEKLVLKNEKLVLTFGTSRSDIHTDIHTDSSSSSPSASEGKNSPPGKKPPSEAGLRLAECLKSGMLSNNPKAKITPAQIQDWAREADLMLRCDGRTETEIREVSEWSQRDSFWKGIILSMGNLRKHFDRLTLKKGADSYGASNPKGGNGAGNRGKAPLIPESHSRPIPLKPSAIGPGKRAESSILPAV
jgi:hypothetical protein